MEQNAPRLRFPGFSGEWEKKALEDLVSIHARIGWQNLRTSEFLSEGDYYLITGTDFDNGKINFKNCYYVDKERYEQDPHIQVSENSILITKDGTIGKVAYISKINKPGTLNAGVFCLKATTAEIYMKYLFQYLYGPFLMQYAKKHSTGGTIQHLNQGMLVKLPVPIPSLPEQEKIADFFSALDEKIDLKEKEIEDVKTLKKGFLQKMFPQDGESAPRLRFPGFSGEWEKKTLGEIANRITRKNSNHETNRPLTISAEHGLVDQTDFFSKQVASENLEKYYLLYKNEFAYNRSAAKGYKYGVIRYLKAYEEGAVSTLYICFKLKKGSQKFLEAYFDSHKLDHQLKGATAEGSRNHGLLNITTDDFFKIPLLMPTLPEQEKIADFFTALDEKIDTMEQQLEDLKEMKKGFLQQMFI